MKCVTIQIGNSDDKLTQKQWHDYFLCTDTAIRSTSYQIHFAGSPSNTCEWQNYAWVAIFSDNLFEELKLRLKTIREKFCQDSIAFTVGETEFI